MKVAREVGANKKRTSSDALLGRLATTAPVPHAKMKKKSPGK
jgi:hypothetical protein